MVFASTDLRVQTLSDIKRQLSKILHALLQVALALHLIILLSTPHIASP